MCISLTKSVSEEVFYSISLFLQKAFKSILQVIRKFHIQMFGCFQYAGLKKVEGIFIYLTITNCETGIAKASESLQTHLADLPLFPGRRCILLYEVQL